MQQYMVRRSRRRGRKPYIGAIICNDGQSEPFDIGWKLRQCIELRLKSETGNQISAWKFAVHGEKKKENGWALRPNETRVCGRKHVLQAKWCSTCEG